LKAERNAAQARVFPRLRELSAQHGASLQPIDLRWGVSEEASLDQQAMKTAVSASLSSSASALGRPGSPTVTA